MIDQETYESNFTHLSGPPLIARECAWRLLPLLITYLEGRLCFILPEKYIGPTLRAIEADYRRVFRIKL